MADDDDSIAALARELGLYDLVHDILRAAQAARETKDPTTRATKRQVLGDVLGKFLQVTGSTAELRDEMVEHMLDVPGNEIWKGKSFAELTRSEMLRTKGGEAAVRTMAEVALLRLFGLLGAKFTNVTVGELRRLPTGYDGVFSFLPKAGVKPGHGPTHALAQKTVNRLGYTVGVQGGRLTRALLVRAVEYFDQQGVIHQIPPTKLATMRDWTQREHAKVYEDAVKNGITARETGTIDRLLRL